MGVAAILVMWSASFPESLHIKFSVKSVSGLNVKRNHRTSKNKEHQWLDPGEPSSRRNPPATTIKNNSHGCT